MIIRTFSDLKFVEGHPQPHFVLHILHKVITGRRLPVEMVYTENVPNPDNNLLNQLFYIKKYLKNAA